MTSSDLHLTRRSLLISGAAALAATIPAFGAEHEPTFLAIGDWGFKGSSGQRKVAAAMTSAARHLAPRFVISVGDNFYGKGVRSVDDPHWQESFEAVYDAPELMCPWYPVLGNHDHGGNVDAEIAFQSVDARWQMAARYYRKSEVLSGGAAADFFFLDTTPIVAGEDGPAGAGAQLGWLERELAASGANWKIVVGHHPVFSGGKHGSSRVLVEGLKPLIDRFGVRAYLNGHDHDLQHIAVDGVHYLTCGAGAKTRPTMTIEGTLFAESRRGFMAGMFGPEALGIVFVDEAGDILHKASIPLFA
jgi:tartrate-resistant acid phosphatase type 5